MLLDGAQETVHVKNTGRLQELLVPEAKVTLQKTLNPNRKTAYDLISVYKLSKRYISSPYKYYFTDVGLRNAQLNFRQQEENHIMENIIYNELLVRGRRTDLRQVNCRNTDACRRKPSVS